MPLYLGNSPVGGVKTSVLGDSVLYTEQNLTEKEKAQARENIGAISIDEVNVTVDTTISETSENPIANKTVKSYVDTKVADIVESAPETLDTLNELAAALGDDPNFATTVATQIGNKVDKIDGKGLSTNDYTTAEKEKLAGIAAGATKVTSPSDIGAVQNLATYYSVTTAKSADDLTDSFALIPVSADINPDLFNIVGGTYAYVHTSFYISAEVTSRRMQIAVSYNGVPAKMAIRIYGANGWLAWREIAYADSTLDIASPGTAIPSGANLDEYLTPGAYRSASSTNSATLTNPPWSNAGFKLIVMKHYSTTGIMQLALPQGVNVAMKFRYYESSKWTGWRSVYDSGNKPTPADIGAISNVGGTITGDLNVSRLSITDFSQPVEVSKYIDFHTPDDATDTDYVTRIFASADGKLYIMPINQTEKEILHTGNKNLITPNDIGALPIKNLYYAGNIDVITEGAYIVLTGTGDIPFTHTWYDLIAIPSGTGGISQIAMCSSVTGTPTQFKFRHHNGEGWSSWSEAATTNYALNKAGDKMTGDLRFADVGTGTNTGSIIAWNDTIRMRTLKDNENYADLILDANGSITASKIISGVSSNHEILHTGNKNLITPSDIGAASTANAETWVFTLADGSTVSKEVILK